MGKKTTKTSKVAAWILWIVNFIVMMICILMVAFGLWIISSPSTILTVIDASGCSTMKALLQDMLTLQVGIALTAIAVFLFFVCFMGFYGAITRSPFLLFMYSALVLLLLLLECALLYYFSSNLVEKGLQDDGQWTHAMRLAFQCCEHKTSIPVNNQAVKNQTVKNQAVNNQTTTKKPPWHSIPWSCCGPDAYPDNCTSSQMFKEDCHASTLSWLDRYQLPIYTSLAVLHVILSSCSFVRRSSHGSRSYS